VVCFQNILELNSNLELSKESYKAIFHSNINGLSKDYSILMESLFKRIEKMGVKVGTLYMDRELFNTNVF
jgi:hypothetical protein